MCFCNEEPFGLIGVKIFDPWPYIKMSLRIIFFFIRSSSRILLDIQCNDIAKKGSTDEVEYMVQV